MLKGRGHGPRPLVPIVIGLGPGYHAGRDCHAVVETNRGHNLGRVLYEGSAETDTGIPAPVLGHSARRLLRAPAAGTFRALRSIGEIVREGDVLGSVDGHPVSAQIDGVLRGLLHDGVKVSENLKIGDVDPRGDPVMCRTISDKANAVAGGVLEACLTLARRRGLLAL